MSNTIEGPEESGFPPVENALKEVIKSMEEIALQKVMYRRGSFLGSGVCLTYLYQVAAKCQ
ncbi:hypothetical protein TSUD_378850 [Trifolium subterraneum]|uniref:Uncharacterized protein n=1 Tax=Trifolium subterraneum TaxID=3900 RepID=A0A2Z6P5M6_TRISU|nr:hypothetical protein TSUD_378850 [Trifolium subterraneum]